MESSRNIIDRRVLTDLKKRSTFGIVFYLILVFVVFSTDNYYLQNQYFTTGFSLALCIICSIRFIHVYFFERLANWNERLNKFLFITLILITAATWGTGFALVMVLKGPFYTKSLMTICTAGLCAGGVVAFLPNCLLAFFFNALIMLPATVVVLVRGENISLASVFFFYFGYMLILAYRGNNEYWAALENEIKLKEQSDTLERLSRIDVLTGMYNRRHFDEVFEAEWKRSSREGILCTVVLGDIDHFKTVNDTYGHLAGDAYLKHVADILSAVFQRDTDLVARYGGEEFVILLPDTNSIQAYEMAEKVRTKIEASTVHYNYNNIKTTISFGIASEVPDYRNTSATLISKVDGALYRAKEEGRNRIVIAKNGNKAA